MSPPQQPTPRIRVGIGGWLYEPWRGTFYPDGLAQHRELEHASRQIDMIEINSTYYRSQAPATFATWRELRKQCPCATCVDDRAKPPNPFRVLSAKEVAAGPPAPVSMKAVGLYAYQISWNDGHSTGIYTVAALRKMSAVV